VYVRYLTCIDLARQHRHLLHVINQGLPTRIYQKYTTHSPRSLRYQFILDFLNTKYIWIGNRFVDWSACTFWFSLSGKIVHFYLLLTSEILGLFYAHGISHAKRKHAVFMYLTNYIKSCGGLDVSVLKSFKRWDDEGFKWSLKGHANKFCLFLWCVCVFQWLSVYCVAWYSVCLLEVLNDTVQRFY
jgi:hypothetical protein